MHTSISTRLTVKDRFNVRCTITFDIKTDRLFSFSFTFTFLHFIYFSFDPPVAPSNPFKKFVQILSLSGGRRSSFKEKLAGRIVSFIHLLRTSKRWNKMKGSLSIVPLDGSVATRGQLLLNLNIFYASQFQR